MSATTVSRTRSLSGTSTRPPPCTVPAVTVTSISTTPSTSDGSVDGGAVAVVGGVVVAGAVVAGAVAGAVVGGGWVVVSPSPAAPQAASTRAKTSRRRLTRSEDTVSPEPRGRRTPRGSRAVKAPGRPGGRLRQPRWERPIGKHLSLPCRVASVGARPTGGTMKKLILILAVVAILTLLIKALGKEGALE